MTLFDSRATARSDAALRSACPAPVRRRWLLGAAGVAAAAAGTGVAWWRHDRAEQAGVHSPQPSRADLDAALWSRRWPVPAGGELTVAELRGKPLLLNCWATWCPPCVEELPLLDRFAAQHAASGWQVLALALDKLALVRAFLLKHPLKLPVAVAETGGIELMRSLGNGMGSLPFTVVIDRRGDLVHRKMGTLKPDELAQIDRAFGG